MDDKMLEMVVAALRDTAAKTLETKTRKEKRFVQDHIYGGRPPEQEEVDVTEEAYSKDWIAGRLLGMADAIEAMK